MAVSGRDIAQLERAVSNQLAAYSQTSGAIFDKLPPIKVNALRVWLVIILTAIKEQAETEFRH